MENRKELIKLAHANVTQHSNGVIKTDWTIRENVTGDELGILPKKLDEKEVFSILNMSRKYELEAFNIGINYGKEKHSNVYEPIVAQLKDQLQRAVNENERLSEALDLEQNKIK